MTMVASCDYCGSTKDVESIFTIPVQVSEKWIHVRIVPDRSAHHICSECAREALAKAGRKGI